MLRRLQGGYDDRPDHCGQHQWHEQRQAAAPRDPAPPCLEPARPAAVARGSRRGGVIVGAMHRGEFY
jgi:hypothetical protein